MNIENQSAIPKDQLDELASHILDTYDSYQTLNRERNEKLLKVYKAYSTYEEEKKADWLTNIKVNKAHEIVERVLPRIIAKNPRWLVTPKTNDFYPEQELPKYDLNVPESVEAYNQALDDKKQKTRDYARAIQDYLEYIFDEYNYEKPLRAYAKQMCVYGKGRAKICYKYETIRNLTEVEDENGEIKQEIKEEVVGEYPWIDVKSWTEITSDPRFRSVRDMPAYFEVTDGVRFADLKKNKEFFNLDKLSEVCAINVNDDYDADNYRRKVQQIAEINNLDLKAPIDKNSLCLMKAWVLWCADEDGENERLYEVTLIKELRLIIGCKEVTKIPFVEADAFEDTETNFSVGFVEPILGLQDEMNFQKNSAVNFINQALNRTFIWSQNSGIDPRDLISKPYGVIPTTNDAQTALANIPELPMRQLPSEYFQFQNDIERQIQGQTFTVDTSNPKGQQALTDTATGARIEFYESHVVIDQVRKNFEQALSELAYLIIQEAFENIEDNIVLKKMGAEEYWEINKEVLRDAIRRYSIKVEVGSSTFDDIANRRQDALALYNIFAKAQQAGEPIQMKSVLEEILATFEKRDISKYYKDQFNPAQVVGNMPPLPKSVQPQLPPNPAEVTQQVAGGEMLPTPN